LSGEARRADTRRKVKSRLQFSPRRTLVLHLLLVISLLLAQGAAYAHVSAHLKSPVETSGIDGKATQLCGECLEGAPLLGAAGAPHVPSVVQVAAAVVPIPALACGPAEYRSPYAFQSRAPPRSL
jgi:hypothetical protein